MLSSSTWIYLAWMQAQLTEDSIVLIFLCGGIGRSFRLVQYRYLLLKNIYLIWIGFHFLSQYCLE